MNKLVNTPKETIPEQGRGIGKDTGKDRVFQTTGRKSG